MSVLRKLEITIFCNEIKKCNVCIWPEPTSKPEAKKRKMQLKRLQSPNTPTPSAVNDHEVHNKNNSCSL